MLEEKFQEFKDSGQDVDRLEGFHEDGRQGALNNSMCQRSY